MKLIWACTEPVKSLNLIQYTFYNSVNKDTIKCKSLKNMVEVGKDIKITLDRMNKIATQNRT